MFVAESTTDFSLFCLLSWNKPGSASGGAGFVWRQYLQDNGFKAAPDECFVQVHVCRCCCMRTYWVTSYCVVFCAVWPFSVWATYTGCVLTTSLAFYLTHITPSHPNLHLPTLTSHHRSPLSPSHSHTITHHRHPPTLAITHHCHPPTHTITHHCHPSTLTITPHYHPPTLTPSLPLSP